MTYDQYQRELDRCQNEVDYWFDVCRLYMDNPNKQDEFNHARSRLDIAVSQRDQARSDLNSCEC